MKALAMASRETTERTEEYRVVSDDAAPSPALPDFEAAKGVAEGAVDRGFNNVRIEKSTVTKTRTPWVDLDESEGD